MKGVYRNAGYIVQTNTDRGMPDPDTRWTVAETKLADLQASNSISRQSIWQILCESPNKNPLTLITVLLDTVAGTIRAEVWDE